ncbi:hypothetical protein BDB01DRAFT_713627 [Pilobolus umbonatus]|nr:hypothetical protein BDB01DRAFT_713627 [Pilobolus umbonatus]
MPFNLELIKPNAQQTGVDFGAVVTELDLENLTDEDFNKLYDAVFTHQVVVVKKQSHVTPKTQYELTKRFDPNNINKYGHDGMQKASQSVLARDITPLPNFAQVQLLGHGIVKDHCGIKEIKLTHPSHTVFHQSVLSREEMEAGYTRFYRWHMDAALYRLNPPKITTLFSIKNPESRREIVRYDDGTGKEIEVQLGTTAFVSGQRAFEILPKELKELAYKTQVKYAAHPYLWISKARAHPTGLGIVCEGRELPTEELPEIDEKHRKIYPMLWKNPVTNKIHLQVHPCAVEDLIIDGKPVGDLNKVREILYSIQRPSISPENVFAHEWEEGDFVIFHNRGVLHSVVGSLKDDDQRIFHQCNIASADEPISVTAADIAPYLAVQ